MIPFFPNVPKLLDAIFSYQYWRKGSALFRIFAPYSAGGVLIAVLSGTQIAPKFWWAWLACGAVCIFLIVRRISSYSMTGNKQPMYAIPLLLTVAGSGFFMIADGVFARFTVSFLLIFSLMITTRTMARSHAAALLGKFTAHTTFMFASSVAILSVSATMSTLVVLMNFLSVAAVAVVFLCCLALSRQTMWHISKHENIRTAWEWVLSIACMEVYALTLLLPLPIITSAALVWCTYLLCIEFFYLRGVEQLSKRRISYVSTAYAAACIIILTTTRWP